MLRLCPAILAASCALAQTITVGVVAASPDSAEGTNLIPAGRYEAGRWLSQGVKNLPQEWQFWDSTYDGTTVKLVSPCKVADCWTTDLPPAKVAKPKSAGAVVSPKMRIDPFQDVAEGSDEYKKIDAFLAPVLQGRLRQRIRNLGLNPTADKAGRVQRFSRALVDGSVYYHVERSRDIYDPKAAQNQCQFFQFLFDAWVRESPTGQPAVIGERSQFDDCNGPDLIYLDPAGALVLNGTTFIVGQQLYYEGAAAVVLRLGSGDIRVVARHHWTPD